MATLDGKNPITATLAITTTAPAGTLALLPRSGSLGRGPEFLAVLLLPFAVCYVPLRKMRRGRLASRTLLLIGLLAGCGGTAVVKKPLPANTPPGTYTITVQSQSGSLAHAGQIFLTIR